ncbi:hypothetical protein DPMN_080649 [Dreissena polymorpha]|uniref:Uncharacterized protein n=1 Tax=Dreissena polymorpha TaxID=45954 RepID=A0A9D4BU10_DREPO|nr:hypothetical protein DPMN_080649 [Dreissena polymorpha]
MYHDAFGDKSPTPIPQTSLIIALQRLPNPPTAGTPVVPYFVFPNDGPVLWNPPASI